MFKLSFNHYWRIIAAGISYVVFVFGALLPGLYAIGLALFPLNVESKQSKVRKAVQYLCYFYVNFMQFLGLITINLECPQQTKLKGHLVISNHSMLIDALLALAYIDNLSCVVKHQLFVNPFTRIPVNLAGYISNRSTDFIDRACSKIEAGENVLIFPEGTRNSYDTQLDFKRGAANIAVISDCPVLPLIICASPRIVQKGESWYQLPPVKSQVLLRINKPLALNDCINTTIPRTLQYRRLTAFWHNYYLAEITSIAAARPGLNMPGG